MTVTDKDGDIGTAFQDVVVYDANGGFVTGGGWIGADRARTKATFAFNAKYGKDATTPGGQTQFQAGELNFHSTSYEWLIVAGGKAQFQGQGRINGRSGYAFIVTAVDGGARDQFQIRIWDRNTGSTVYDDAGPRDLGGGSIVIHPR